MGDKQRLMLGKVARLYYEHGLTQGEIGELLGTSRIKVTRLLAEARKAGVVEITVHSSARPFEALESALIRAYDVDAVWVCPGYESEDLSRGVLSLGLVGAEAIASVLAQTKRVAVGLSAAIAASVAQLAPLPYPELEIFPLTGSRAGRAHGGDPHEVVSSLARTTGGTSFHLPAPVVAGSPNAAASYREDPRARAILDSVAASDTAIFGVGGNMRSTHSLASSLQESDFEDLRRAGAVGDLLGRFFDSDGNTLSSPINERMVGLDIDQLRRIPTRLVIAGGTTKYDPLHTVLSHGLATALVTDSAAAEEMLRRSHRTAR